MRTNRVWNGWKREKLKVKDKQFVMKQARNVENILITVKFKIAFRLDSRQWVPREQKIYFPPSKTLRTYSAELFGGSTIGNYSCHNASHCLELSLIFGHKTVH